jgi:Tol biopolymer transport system component
MKTMHLSIITIAGIISLVYIPTASYSMYVGPVCNEGYAVGLPPYFTTKVAFISNVGNTDPNDFSLYTVNSDGSGDLAKIGKISYGNNPILLSSDGKKIAFTGSGDRTSQVFVANTDGTDIHQITHDNNPKSAIAISPDGKKIIYAVHPYEGVGEVGNFFAIDSDGTNLIRLTNDSAEKSWSAVSADGTTLVFNGLSNTTIDKIFSVRTDGSNLHYVTDGSLFSHVPEIISDDGSKIVFSRENQNDSNTKYLFTINTDGTGLVNLLPYPIYSQSDFTISPDGSKVAFDDNNMKENHVSVVNSDGTGYTRIYDLSNFMSMPLFSHNGSKLIFLSPSADKVILSVADTDKKRQPAEISIGLYPGGQMFSKDGSRIIFSSYINGTMQTYLTSLDGKSIIPLIDNSHFKPNPECRIPFGGGIDQNRSYIQDSAFSPNTQVSFLPLILVMVVTGVIGGTLVYFFKMRIRK